MFAQSFNVPNIEHLAIHVIFQIDNAGIELSLRVLEMGID